MAAWIRNETNNRKKVNNAYICGGTFECFQIILFSSPTRSVFSWENYSCKTTKLEFVNAPMHINFFLDTFRLFMSPKMKERLFVSRGPSTVETTLPTDLGGDGTSYKELAAQWKENVCAHAAWYAEQEKYKTVL